MAISIAITKRLTIRFGAGFLPVANVRNELTNAVGLASSCDANGNLTNHDLGSALNSIRPRRAGCEMR